MIQSATPVKEQKPWQPSWISRSAFSVVSILFYATEASLMVFLYHGNFWLVVPLVLICSHFMHGLLIGFHEASHSMLRKSRAYNDFEGALIGTFSTSGYFFST